MNLCNLTPLHDHKGTDIQSSFMLCNNFKNYKGFHRTFRFSVISLILLFSSFQTFSQGVIPTKGKDFWIGFPYNPYFGTGTRRCDVFITSEVSTNGTISIPQQGWSQTFTVTANQTTTITLPIGQVEHTTSEIIEDKGVEVITQDTVSVFAISFQTYTADATVVYPKQSLGTEYRIASYKGLSNSSPPNLNSELMVVSTEDGTQVIINPVVPTLGGHPAGIPFTVNLNAGESYQVLSSTYSNDLTGTVIKATDSSGSCRPFAVFSGSTCVNIPPGCGACDILYEQALPVANWGKTYYAVPFSFATDYTLRVLADQNSTIYTIDGGAPIFLNAGQFTEINNIPGSCCVIANKPVSVIQYMQGMGCAGAGDPAMMYLNSQEQKIDRVTFSTVTSAVINQHDVNIIMNTSHISQLTLDGIPVAAASFTPMTYCSTVSYAQLPLSQGSHTLAADSGFTAYIYGTGSYESYAYSVGSYSKTKPIHVDSIFCTSDTVNLGTQNFLYGIWWSTNTDPNDTISTSPVLTLTPPIVPDIYIEHGNEYISGCEKTYYFNVEVPDPPQAWITIASNTACLNQQVQLNAGTIPASSIYQYSWTPVTGLSNPNIANPVATATTSLWYYVAISSPNGCAPTVYDSIYLNVLPIPLPNVGSNPATICLGDSAILTASGGVSYLWNPGGYTGSSISVSPAISTNYIVYVTDSNGCGNSDTVSVTVNPLPNANAGADQSICTGANATLSATGGVSYLWAPGGAITGSITVSPTSSTNYIVQVTGANGCSQNDSVYITVNPLPLANAGPDEIICSGASVTLSASGGSSYLWTPGGNITSSILVSPLSSTNYIVKVTDLNGCENSDTVNVAVNPIPVANAGADQTICSGAFATLTATGGAFYLWTPGGSTSNSIAVSPGSSTNYIVTVSDSIGCHSMDTVHVTVNLLPAADAGPNTSVCVGESVTLTASPSGASYLWTPPGSTNSSITVSPTVTTTYILEVTDSNSCQKIDSVQVTVYPAAVANAGADQSICSGFQATLTATGGVSYLWTPGGATTSSITVSPAITTNYIVKVTDSNGCEDYDTVLVAVTTYITGSASTQSVCLGSSTILNASGGVSYLWIPGGNTTSSITVSPQSSSDYIVHITTSIGCLIYDTIHVNVNLLPLANAGSDQEICFGSYATLTASGGTSYLWITTGSTNDTIAVSPVTGQNYIVQVTDNNGCQKNDTVYVAVNPLPIANAGADQSVCPGASATLIATGGISYLWTPGGSTNASIIVSPVIPTTYIVWATDVNGCKDTDTALVTLNPLPVAGFSVSSPLCENSPLSFNNSSSVSSGSITYNQWNFGDGSGAVSENAIHSYAFAGNYPVVLIVTSNYNCIDSIEHMIGVNPNPAADFSTQNICVWQPTPFNDLSTVAGSNIVQWYWDFGDGSSEVIQNPLHIYSHAGMYDVELTVTSDSGCAVNRLKAQAVEIYPLPEPHFKVVPDITSIFEPVIHFIDQSTNGTIWQWNFGDNKGSSGLPNPFYSYNDTGIFNVSMILTSNYGCVDSSNGEVYIVPDFAIYFPNAFTPNGDNRNDFYSPYGIGMSDFDIYIFDRWGNELFHSENILFCWNGKAGPGNLDCSEGIYAYLAKATDYKKIRHQFRGTITLVK